MQTTEPINDPAFYAAPASVVDPQRKRKRKPVWMDRSFAILVAFFTFAFGLACASVYYLLAETQRSATSSLLGDMQHQQQSSAAAAEQPRSVNDHTVAIPNCGPDRSFSAFPEHELVERTVHVFDCGSTRYILMPPVEGR